ncbi:putative Phox-associated domain, PX domain superfamily [Helianthus annuus]|nr:putative Phox-associated domain, PX domain superfamily [Helianthus annuus]
MYNFNDCKSIMHSIFRDVVDLLGEHLEVFRKNQAAIGREVMVTLSSDERDERLKHHLMASKELHPALISSESEYKFLKRIIGALLTAVLRPREAQCPVVRCIARELLTCLVVEPVMRFACPGRINELIEALFLANNTKEGKDTGGNQSTDVTGQSQTPNQEKSQDSTFMKDGSTSSQKNDTPKDQKETVLNPSGPMACGPVQDEPLNPPTSAWARVLVAATQRRTEVLHPENLENMWTKGRNYKKRTNKKIEGSGINENSNDQITEQNVDGVLSDQSKTSDPSDLVDESNSQAAGSKSKSKMERSDSVSDSNVQNQVGGSIISEFYSANVDNLNNINTVSDKVTRTEGCVPKLRCRVLGAYYENIDSKSIAVYSIAVTDADNKTWFVKRRYSNFDRLHQNLKNTPNYTLQLPPKRIFSSNTDDTFVYKRCIQLNKYLQDLLSIANIADQHEVRDFLSMSSKVCLYITNLPLQSYSSGRSSSVARTLAVNVDDGSMKKVTSPCLPSDLANSFTDNEEGEKDRLVNHEEKVSPAAQPNEQIVENSENFPSVSALKEDPLGVPAEWSPPNVSVPLLNLVDKIFQLKKRGWLSLSV